MGDRYTRCMKYCFLRSERPGMLAPSSGHGKQGIRGEVFIISDLQKYDIIDSEVHRRSDSSETNCAWMLKLPSSNYYNYKTVSDKVFKVFPDQQTHSEPCGSPETRFTQTCTFFLSKSERSFWDLRTGYDIRLR